MSSYTDAALCAGITVCGAAVAAAWAAPRPPPDTVSKQQDVIMGELARVLAQDWRSFTAARIARILGTIQTLETLLHGQPERVKALRGVLEAAGTSVEDMQGVIAQHEAAIEELVARAQDMETDLEEKEAEIRVLRHDQQQQQQSKNLGSS